MTNFISVLLRNAVRRRTTLRLLELDDHLLEDIGFNRTTLRSQIRRRG